MGKTIFILSHTNGQPGGLDTIVEYLHNKGHETLILLHPLDDYTIVPTTFRREAGELKEIIRKPRGIFNFFEDFIISVRIVNKSQFDTIISASNFDTIPAIFCRLILRKKINKIIYYPRDYSEERFNSKVFNTIYVWVENIATKHSDYVISNTKRAENKRLELGLEQEKSLVIPNSINLVNPKFLNKIIRKDHFIYVGDVSKEHGLFDLIEILSPLIKKLVIIGSGTDWDRTIKLANSKSFELELHYAKSRKFVLDYLEKYNGIGLAPYNMSSKWTYYCSPLKVGEYICCSIPVIVSSVPEVSEIVKANGLGISYYTLDLKEIQKQIRNLNTSNFQLKAKNYYKENSAKVLLSKLPL